MDGIMKIAKSLKESGLLIRGVSNTIGNEAKEKKRGSLSMLLGILQASLIRNILVAKVAIQALEGTIRAGQDF